MLKFQFALKFKKLSLTTPVLALLMGVLSIQETSRAEVTQTPELDVPMPRGTYTAPQLYTPVPRTGPGTPATDINYSPVPLTEPPATDAPYSYNGAPMNCRNPQGDFACMACNCFNEAVNNPIDQLNVGKVVMTRLRLPQYPLHRRTPRSVCGIIKDRHQFSWFNQMRSRRTVPRNHGCFRSSAQALQFKGYFADHYHANYVRPGWARGMRLVYNGIQNRRGREPYHIYYEKFRSSFRPPAS